MIDIDFIKSKIEPSPVDESRKIRRGDHVTREVMGILIKGKTKDVLECFAINDETSEPFLVDCYCVDCQKLITANMSKSKLLEQIRQEKKCVNMFVCDECAAIRKATMNAKIRLSTIKENLDRNKNSESFIDVYLNVGYDTTEKNDQQFFIMRNAYYQCDRTIISNYIKSMNYLDFLDTPYWRVIARHVRLKSQYKCSICNKNGVLHVHHRTYEKHGYEIETFGNDLICLCEDCHSKFHND